MITPMRKRRHRHLAGAVGLGWLVMVGTARADDGGSWNELMLRRAVARWSVGDVAGAAEALDARETPGPDETRADFLRIRAGLRLGDRAAAYTGLRRAAAGGAATDVWSHRTAATGLIEALRDGGLSGETGFFEWTAASGELFPSAPLVIASIRLRHGQATGALDRIEGHDAKGPSDAIRDALEAQARIASGIRPDPALTRLARSSERSEAGRDLAGAARLRLAAEALSRGEDPRPDLERVPSDSAWRARALRMLALADLAEGRRDDAQSALQEAIASDDAGPDARMAGRDLGLLRLEDGLWAEASEVLRVANERRLAEKSAVERFLDGPNSLLDAAWRDHLRPGNPASALVLAGDRTEAAWAEVEADALDLNRNRDPRRPDFGPPSFPASDSDDPAAQLRTTPDRRDRVISTEVAAADARGERDHLARALAAAAGAQAREERYFDRGLVRIDGELGQLGRQSARVDSLLSRSADLAARLAAIRDEEIRRIESRTADLREHARKNRLAAQALNRLRAGSSTLRPVRMPAGVPSPTELLTQDEALASQLDSWTETFSARAPNVVARSHDEIWNPRATRELALLAEAASARLAEANRVRTAIAATRAEAIDPARLDPERRDLASSEERLALAEELAATRRRGLVVDAAREAVARLDSEGEALTYGLAVATHEIALGQEDDDGLAVAVNDYRGFLESYPGSVARSEARYRLADAMMRRAQTSFHAQVRRFLGENEASPDLDAARLAPFVDYEPSLAVYVSILENDPQYARIDGVLYHIGMIRADRGDVGFAATLERLVRDHPGSPFAQEAHLRLGDDLFERREYAACVPHYERAAAGADAEHTAIAQYRIGWARWERDEFDAAAAAFLALLDHYELHPKAARTTDLRREAEEYLTHSLARGGGAPAFVRLFEGIDRPEEPRLLTGLGRLLRRFSLFEEAIAADSLWLARWPEAPGALDAAGRLAATQVRAEDPDGARNTRLALAPQFRPGSAWAQAIESDSLRAAGDEFARDAYHRAALYHHRQAREAEPANPAAWSTALDLYAELLSGWPAHESAARLHWYAGEAAWAMHDADRALAHFETAAASDSTTFSVDAAWRAIGVRDAVYETARAESPAGPDSLANALIDAIDGFAEGNPGEEHVPDLRWRAASLRSLHGRPETAARAFLEFVRFHPDDDRGLEATRRRGAALVEAEQFQEAAEAWQTAAAMARKAGADSLASDAEARVPRCLWADAERAAAAAPDRPTDWAPRFEELADTHPDWEHADQALYRAGLAWAGTGDTAGAVRAWTALIEGYPGGEFARDAHLKTAETWEEAGHHRAAAREYERFSETFPDDPDAASALRQAVQLLAAAGNPTASDAAADRYMDRFPDDVDTAADYLEARVEIELAAGGGLTAVATTRWLALAESQPDVVSRGLGARIAFLRAEEARAAYDDARITLPLAPSVAEKKALLERVLGGYRECASRGISPWNRAAMYRVGECLVGFGDALMDSERPADLAGDDLVAWDEVLEEQSWAFFDRGEEAWTEILRQASATDDGEWIEHARRSLWPRLAERFTHRPEVEMPMIAAHPSNSGGR